MQTFRFGLGAQPSQNSVGIGVYCVHPHCVDLSAGVQRPCSHLNTNTHTRRPITRLLQQTWVSPECTWHSDRTFKDIHEGPRLTHLEVELGVFLLEYVRHVIDEVQAKRVLCGDFLPTD